ncbi:MAG: DNA repair protein RecO [Clostridia bacterium]|nr:DNA repair protein RecO [Clostridia bacterium]
MGEAVKIQAIVLKKVDYKDADRVLTLFSPQVGKIIVSAKGIKKQNSKLRASSEVFAFGTFVLNETRGRYTVTGYDSIDSFHELREDFDRLSLGALLLNVCEKAIAPNEPDLELFNLLLNCLDYLRNGNVEAGFTAAVFLFKFCELFGYKPEMNECAQCAKEQDLIYLSASLGGVACVNCNNNDHVAITGGCLYYMRKIYSLPIKEIFLIKPTQTQVKELYRTACYYTAYFFDEKIKIMDYITKYGLI